MNLEWLALPPWLFIWFVFNGVVSYFVMVMMDAYPRDENEQERRETMARHAFMNAAVMMSIGSVVFAVGFAMAFGRRR